MPPQLLLVRHGETEWTISGQHTGGATDIPLTENGREQAERHGAALAGREFARVLSSPLSRALDTCRLAGLGDVVETTEDLVEWNYGEYDGLTTPAIREKAPGWSLWTDGAPGGETAADVGARVDRILEEVRSLHSAQGAARAQEGDVVLFAHGHVLRVLTARWLGLPPTEGRLFALYPASVSVLGFERETPVIIRWNAPAGEPIT
ncbi:MAG: histidine phosphatase family protein [Acidimicrobiales bacterium]|nr:histidine phosphatase family protein [Actinomycetota bacterium]